MPVNLFTKSDKPTSLFPEDTRKTRTIKDLFTVRGQPLFTESPAIIRPFIPFQLNPRIATQPISKLITGQSVLERLNEPLRRKSEEIVSQAAIEGRRVGMPEAFARQIPAATIEALAKTVDLSPLDVGVIAATAGIMKLPFGKTGLTLGEVASKVPVGKGFFKAASELGRYQQWLKFYTPLTSRGVQTTVPLVKNIKVLEPGNKKSTLNLDKYDPEVQEGMRKLLQAHPDVLDRGVIHHSEVERMASQLQSTPIARKILSLPEGQMAAEVLKMRQGEDAVIRSALEGDLRNFGLSLKEALQLKQTKAVGKLATELGRGVEQFRIPVEAQAEYARLINQKILQIKRDPFIKGAEQKRLVEGLVDLRKFMLSKDFNPTWLDKGYEFWINSILSGPWTHTVNITSNTLFVGMKPIEKALYATADIPLSAFTGRRTHFFAEIPQQIKGAGQALFTRKKLATGIAKGSKLDIRTGHIRGAKGEIIRMPTRVLVGEDNFSKRLVGFMEHLGRAEAIARQEGLKGPALVLRRNQLIANPTERLVTEVAREQLIRTFQDSTGLSEMLRVVQAVPGGRWILPFRTTLASIVNKGLDRSPVGFIKIGVKGVKALKGGTYPQYQLAMDLGNASLGTAMFAGVAYGLKKGVITGAAPKDRGKRDVFYKQNKQPYSILYRGNYIPISRIEPYGTSAMQMIDFLQGYFESDKEIPSGKLADAVTSMFNTYTNKTFLSGMTNAVKAITDPERYGETWIIRMLTGFSPFSALTRQTTQMADTTVRKPEGIVEAFKAQIPGLAEQVPARVSSFGEIIKRKPIGFSRFTPFPITRQENDIVANELARLDISLGYPSKKIDGEKMDRKTYNYFLSKTGGAATRTLLGVMQNPGYKDLPDEYKKKLINRVINNTRSAVRNQMRIDRVIRRKPVDLFAE